MNILNLIRRTKIKLTKEYFEVSVYESIVRFYSNGDMAIKASNRLFINTLAKEAEDLEKLETNYKVAPYTERCNHVRCD